MEFSWHMCPHPLTSLCSGVWLESVSQWGRNQRASLEAGDAGHPGPTAPGPAGQEHRVQRGSATTPSKAWREHLFSSLLDVLGGYSRMARHHSWRCLEKTRLIPKDRKTQIIPKDRKTRWFTHMKQSTSILIGFNLTSESHNTSNFIPSLEWKKKQTSFKYTHNFLLNMLSMCKSPGAYAIKSFQITYTVSVRNRFIKLNFVDMIIDR